VGIRQGLVNTIHAYTNDQNLLDKPHHDLYRARAAALSMIPTSTGAAKTIGLVLPELAGRLDGLSVRVPTPTVSLLDLTFTCERPSSREAINAALQQAAQQLPAGVMECNALPLVSSDFTGHPVSCVVDLGHTRVQGDLVKVLAWYDNEWAFANRMLDVALAWTHP
jgi:glyceraldehyde 3-phosphate dehydrogenase